MPRLKKEQLGDGAPKCAALYIRVSTDNQLDNYSIEEQTDRLKAYCQAKNWVVEKVYTDGGFSGGNMERPALRQMIQDIVLKKFDLVLVYKLDRLSRSQKDTLTLIEDVFLKNGIDFVSMNENFDTSTPFGRAMIGILSVFAQLEKDQITERFTMGRIGRSKAGYFHGGGNAPTGYRYENGLLIVDELGAAQVREIYQLFLNGKSLVGIVKEMKHKYGGQPNTTHVSVILKNSIYIGKVKFKGVEYQGLHEPIISKDQFERSQELMKCRKEDYQKTVPLKTPFRADYLLSGMVFCTRCGARYCVVHGSYRCYSRSKTSQHLIKDPNCKNDNWKTEVLEELVKDRINSLVFDFEKVDKLSEKNNRPRSVDLAALKKRDLEIQSQTARLIELYQVGSIPMEQISQRVQHLEEEHKSILSTLAKSADTESDATSNFIRILKQNGDILQKGSLDEQRLFARSLITAIKIDGKRVDIEWRI